MGASWVESRVELRAVEKVGLKVALRAASLVACLDVLKAARRVVWKAV